MKIGLHTEVKPRKRKTPLLSWLALLALLAYGAYGIYNYYQARQERKRWATFIEKVGAVPGVVVTQSGKAKDGEHDYYIKGLRDPLAPNPLSLAGQSGLRPEDISVQWTYYQSLLPRYILARSRSILSPPDTVRLELKNGVLTAAGSADDRWKADARLLARAISGIRGFDQERVTNLDERGFNTLITRILKQRFTFDVGSAEIRPEQQEKLDTFIKDVHILFATARTLNKQVRILVTGHTDASGTDTVNKRIRAARADMIMKYMIARGIPAAVISAAGSQPASDTTGDIQSLSDEQRRAVTFTVIADQPITTDRRP